MSKRVLVTGCSSGFGLVTAIELANSGWRVFATVRNPRDAIYLNSTAGSLSLDLTVLDRFDVIDPGITERIRGLGPLDAVVNNAGYSLWGPVEAVRIDEVRQLLEVNLLGALRVIQAVLPGMRARRCGHVVNIGSSVNLKVGAALYAASKSALRVLTAGLELEARPFGISVVLLEPGKYATKYTRNRVISLGDVGAMYLDVHGVKVPTFDRVDEGKPRAVARLITHILDNPQPRLIYDEEDVRWCSG